MFTICWKIFYKEKLTGQLSCIAARPKAHFVLVLFKKNVTFKYRLCLWNEAGSVQGKPDSWRVYLGYGVAASFEFKPLGQGNYTALWCFYPIGPTVLYWTELYMHPLVCILFSASKNTKDALNVFVGAVTISHHFIFCAID